MSFTHHDLVLGAACLVVAAGLVLLALRRSRSKKQISPRSAPDEQRAISVSLGTAENPSDTSSSIAEAGSRPTSAVPGPGLTDDQRVTKGLGRTKAFLQQTFDRLFSGSQGGQFFDDMEEILLTADIGVDFTEKVMADLKESFGMRLPDRQELRSRLGEILLSRLPAVSEAGTPSADFARATQPHVIMIVGVNGAGKTTTVGKLCQRYRAQNKRVLVGGADTFRAAAIDQLKSWVERAGAEGVFQAEGADPSAVAFDAVQAALSRGVDLCLVDTAGRLHTKVNLMEELKKMKRVIGKAMPTAPHDVWLVVDGSTGQNALNQAREFHEHLALSGIVVTKLDGSAKGGAVLAIGAELKVPVIFIGVGEAAEDLVPFNGRTFVDAVLEGLS